MVYASKGKSSRGVSRVGFIQAALGIGFPLLRAPWHGAICLKSMWVGEYWRYGKQGSINHLPDASWRTFELVAFKGGKTRVGKTAVNVRKAGCRKESIEDTESMDQAPSGWLRGGLSNAGGQRRKATGCQRKRKYGDQWQEA